MNDMNFNKFKKKTFVGRDILDKIYFLPSNAVVILNYNEANKIGIMLLDYLKLEKEFRSLNSKFEETILVHKEEIEKITYEKQDLYDQ